jgi:hypothetical protein
MDAQQDQPSHGQVIAAAGAGGVPYPVAVEDKFRNYLIGHAELGLDLAPVFEHLPEATIKAIAKEALGRGATGARLRITGATDGNDASAALQVQEEPNSSRSQPAHQILP